MSGTMTSGLSGPLLIDAIVVGTQDFEFGHVG